MKMAAGTMIALTAAAVAFGGSHASAKDNASAQSREKLKLEWAKARAKNEQRQQASLFDLLFGSEEKVADSQKNQ